MKGYIIIFAVFSVLAAACAYLIAYFEYSHHFRDKAQVRKLAFQISYFAFAVFVVLSLLSAWVLKQVLG